MPVLQEELEINRLTNLVEAFGWKRKCVERDDRDVVVSFAKPLVEDIPEEAVGPD